MALGITQTDPVVLTAPTMAPPPLEAGDHLTRVEFERRYAAMPELKKAELIEGVVYMPSPVSAKHGTPHSGVITWLGVYRSATPGIVLSDNSTVRLDEDNEPQPDALLAIEPACGGQSRIDEDGYFAGAPELVAEIASSSVSYDLHSKLHVYRRQGVREYLVLRVRDAEVDWFGLVDGQYVPLARDESGLVKSRVFPGLWLDAPAMLRGDLARVLARLQEGIASPEHASFVASLRQHQTVR